MRREVVTDTLNELLRTYVLVTTTFTLGTWPFLLPTVLWAEYGSGVGVPLALAHLIGYCRGYQLLADRRT